MIAASLLRRFACFKALQLVLDLELLALEGRNHLVVVADMGHFVLDLAIELPMPPLEGGDMAFSRHRNSFQLISDDSYRHKYFVCCRPNRCAYRRAGWKSWCKPVVDRLTLRDRFGCDSPQVGIRAC